MIFNKKLRDLIKHDAPVLQLFGIKSGDHFTAAQSMYCMSRIPPRYGAP